MATNMDLSILKLVSPHRRSLQTSRFTLDSNDSSNLISPRGSSSPLLSPVMSGRMLLDEEDDMFTIFDQHRAAIPFKWEETPGIPISEELAKTEMSDSGASLTISRSSSSSGSDVGSSEKAGEEEERFQFTSFSCASHPELSLDKFADELFSNGQIAPLKPEDNDNEKSCNEQQALPLKPPPGMQSLMLSLEAEERSSFNFSSRSLSNLRSNTAPSSHRKSFRRDGLKALPFLASPRGEFHQNNEFLTTMLGFEEWPKTSPEEENNLAIRSKSMSRFSFSFRKKPSAVKERTSSLVEDDDDDIFVEDFGKTRGLRERKTLTSTSSRTIADSVKSRSWASASDTSLDHSYDSDVDTRSEYFSTDLSVPEEVEDAELELREKKQRRALGRLSRFFRSSDLQKPARSSSVSPAPPIARLVPAPCAVKKLKRSGTSAQHQACSANANPLLRMCIAIRSSFEFHSPRFLAAAK